MPKEAVSGIEWLKRDEIAGAFAQGYKLYAWDADAEEYMPVTGYVVSADGLRVELQTDSDDASPDAAATSGESAMKRCVGCGQDTTDEFAWLIEGDGCYWNGHFADSRGFTRSVYEAVRFARFEDAEAVKHWLLQANAFALRTTHHGWTNGVWPKSEDAAATSGREQED